MRVGEGADSGAGAGEAVAAGRAQVSCEVEGCEGIGFEGGDVGGGGAAVEIAEEGHEAADEGSVGFTTERAAAVADLADEVNEGDAAADAMGVGALGFGEGRKFFRAIDDGAEAMPGTPQQFRDHLIAERIKWAAVIKQAKIKGD